MTVKQPFRTLVFPLVLLAAGAGLLAVAGGCGGGTSDEFRQYGELDGGANDGGPSGKSSSGNAAETGNSGSPASNGTNPESESDGAVKRQAAGDPEGTADSAIENTVNNGPSPGDPKESGAEHSVPVKPDVPADAADNTGNAPPAVAKPSGGDLPLQVDTTATAGDDPKALPVGKVQVLIEHKDFQVEGPEGAVRVSFDDIDLLKVLNMEPVTADAPELMPQWLKDLDGKRIRIRGWMYPPFLQTGNEWFALARDNQICCFGKNPKIYDKFPVIMRKGVTTDYILNRPFDVVGVFHIESLVEDGELLQLYEIDDAIVIDQSKR